MKIHDNIALWMQDQFLGLQHDDWSLDYVTSGVLADIPFDTPVRWQLGVDFIYRGLLCDLVKVKDFAAAYDQDAFLHAARTLNPWGDGAGFWHATLVWGTARLDKLIEANFPPDRRLDTLNLVFIEALEAIFAERGVPWSDKPLLPIVPMGSEAAALRHPASQTKE